MKWLGQYIQSFTARFRDDVYLEGLTTTTETDMIVVDSDGLLSKRAIDAITVDVSDFMTNGSDNRVLTATGTDGINAEQYLTYDSSVRQLNILAVGEETHGLYIDADLLTTGSAISVDVDDDLTSASTKSLVKIDYNKEGVTGFGVTNAATGLHINMADGGTNHAGGAVTMIGAQVDIDSANAQGTITQKGLVLNVAADGVGDVGVTSGIEMKVIDGGTDIKMESHANAADFCTISTTTNGATTIKTTDGDAAEADLTLNPDGDILLKPITGECRMTSTVASASNTGGELYLISDDGAALGDDHRLGKLAFMAAEDGGGTLKQGAAIAAYADAAWSASENGTRLEFYTMDGNASSELSLTLDSDLLATFAGAVTVTGALTGTLATVSQPNITGVGTIGTGVWQGTKVASAYLDDDTAHLSGSQTFTGTKTLNSFKGTGGATVTNILDEDAMGSDSATALATQQSIKAYVDARYSYQYIVFLADSDAIVSNQFITPGGNGISNHAWNNDSDLDYTSTDATTIGHANAHITMNYVMGTASIIVPQPCDLVGFYAVGRNESTDGNNFGIGMFVSEESDVDWGGSSTWDATLRAYSLSNGTNKENRAQKIDGMLATPFAMTTGDLITPAVVAPTGDQVKTTITLVLRTLIG